MLPGKSGTADRAPLVDRDEPAQLDQRSAKRQQGCSFRVWVGWNVRDCFVLTGQLLALVIKIDGVDPVEGEVNGHRNLSV